MSGSSNYPGSLDDDASLYDVTDGVTSVVAVHHNNLKEAVKALEQKLGIKDTTVATAIDYRLGNPTGGHIHNGASGQGPVVSIPNINATQVLSQERWMSIPFDGTISTGASMIPGLIVPKTAQVIAVLGGLQIGPSGGTTVIDVHAGPTSLWQASAGSRPMIGPTTGTEVRFLNGTVNLGTVPSGIMLRVDIDGAGANSGGQGMAFTFVFRE